MHEYEYGVPLVNESQSSDEYISVMDDEEQEQQEEVPSPTIISLSSSSAEEEETDELSQWRVVEAVGIVDDAGMEAGGAFVLRDETGYPLLARAFPVAAVANRLLAEAVVLREAVQAMVALGEEGVLFCSSSTKLLRCVHGRLLEGDLVDKASGGVIQQCQDASTCVPEVRFIYRSRAEMERVVWLAEVGARSMQHIQWDAPLMEEIGYV